MTRKQLLKALSGEGFTGTTLDEAQAFIKSANIELKNGDTVLDEAAIKTAWEAKVALVVEGEPKKKAVAITEDEDEGEADEPSPEAQLRKSRAANSEAANAIQTKGAPAIANSKRAMDRKSYEMRIKETAHLPMTDPKRAVHESADQAEFASAFFRLAAAKYKAGFSYGEQANDLAIVKSVCQKASSELNNTSAGILVPTQFMPSVIWLTEEYGAARKLANVQRFTKTDEWKRPRKTANLAMSYIGEGSQITGTDNTYDAVTLTPRKYGGMSIYSTEIWEDSAVSMADEFTKAVAEGQAIAEDSAYFLGDGTATYGNQVGLKNALPASAYLAAGANWGAVPLSIFTTAPGTVENIGNGSNVAWAMSREAYYQTAVRLFNAGGGNKGVDIQTFSPLKPGPNGAMGAINGVPVYFAMVAPTASPATGIPWAYYGNFSAASMLGIHTDLRITGPDTSIKFDYDQIALRAISRFDVNVHGDGRGSTYGPIVALKTT